MASRSWYCFSKSRSLRLAISPRSVLRDFYIWRPLTFKMA